MSFESCIRDAVLREEITQDDADDIIDRFRSYVGGGMARPRARASTMRDYDAVGALRRRQQMLTMAAKDEVDKRLSTYKDHHGLHNAIDAAMGLFEDFGYAGGPNARFYGEAVMGQFFSDIADTLEHFKRKTAISNASLVGGRKNRAQLGDLQRALHGEAASPELQAFAKGILDACDRLRRLFNDYAGDTIPKLENWGGPQSHDPHAVQIAGGAKGNWSPERSKIWWSNFINPMLDWSQMRNPWTGEVFGTEIPSDIEKMRILGRAWQNIVTGGGLADRPSMAKRGGASVANSRSDHRFFVFKDADSRMKYNREFGRGDTLSQILEYGVGMSRDIGLMRVLGPNPAAMTEYMKQVIEHEGHMLTGGVTNRSTSLLAGIDPRRANAEVGKAKHILDGYYEQFRGDRGDETRLAIWGTTLRNYSMSALLGAATIPHLVANPAIQMFARGFSGVGVSMAIPQILASFTKASKAEILRAGFDVDQARHSVGESAKQLDRMRRIMRFSRWFPDRTTHLSGLEPLVEANKGAFMRGMASMLADQQGKEWWNLPDIVRRPLEKSGVGAREWALIQMAELHAPWGGSAKWLRPAEIARVGIDHPAEVLRIMGHDDLFGPNGEPYAESDAGKENAQKIAEDVALRTLAYMLSQREVAVPSSTMRTRAMLTGDSNPNTWWGQLRRSMAMFHGFQGSFMLTQSIAVQHMSTRSKMNSRAYMVGLFIAMGMLMTLSYCLKQMAAGKDAPSLDPRTGEGLWTWINGAVTGGMPWIGEIALGTMEDRFRSPLEMAAGPVAGDAVSLAATALRLLFNSFLTPHNHPSHKSWQSVSSEWATSALRERTPIISKLWYARAAWNRMVVDQLQWNLDHEAHNVFRRQDENLMKNHNQRWWWKPGMPTPDHFPRFSPIS